MSVAYGTTSPIISAAAPAYGAPFGTYGGAVAGSYAPQASYVPQASYAPQAFAPAIDAAKVRVACVLDWR